MSLVLFATALATTAGAGPSTDVRGERESEELRLADSGRCSSAAGVWVWVWDLNCCCWEGGELAEAMRAAAGVE